MPCPRCARVHRPGSGRPCVKPVRVAHDDRAGKGLGKLALHWFRRIGVRLGGHDPDPVSAGIDDRESRVVVRVLALAGPGHPWNPGHEELAVGSAHAIGECPIQLPGVVHDDQAGPVGVLGLELRHAEELNVDVLALERHDWVREQLVVGLGEAEGAVELEDLVDVAARKERNHDLVCQAGSLRIARSCLADLAVGTA